MESHWDTRGLLDRAHPDDQARVQATTCTLLSGQQPRAVSQYRVRTADGWLWIESHPMATEHDPLGRTIHLMGTHADINERKRAKADGEHAREPAAGQATAPRARL